MPYREKDIQQKYFSLGEVAEAAGCTTSAIKFWESDPSWSDFTPKPAILTNTNRRRYNRDQLLKIVDIAKFSRASNADRFERWANYPKLLQIKLKYENEISRDSNFR